MGHSVSEAARNICHTIGLSSISTTTACDWLNRFRNNEYSLKDKSKSGRPIELNLDELKHVIESDPTLSTRSVASNLGCSHHAIQYHFKELRLVSKLGEWQPHDLNQVQLKKRVDACQELLSLRRTNNWLNNLITGDE